MKKLSALVAAALAAVPNVAHSQASYGPFPSGFVTSVPTLGEFGLIALALGIGGLGGWLISRKK
jgi:hypothetical protein